ncbi:MAG: MBOAT family protein [Bryobacterales bacterium]|nr:MBOAT family protein [Bryobacterales bacterium]
MIFHSFEFLFLFLPCALAVYWIPAWAGRREWSIRLLAMASFVFYAMWYWPHVFVLTASVGMNYLVGARIAATRSRGWVRAGVALNLAALGWFKYGAGLGFPVLMPLGISFFTFTQIAFLLDAAEGEISSLSPWRYALFVSFFPHSIAGPILHHRQMMDQFAAPESTRWDWAQWASGLTHFTVGLVKKVAIADTLAPWANAAFGAAGPGSAPEAWMGLVTYALQLYFDFSGYCDMANGLAQLFHIRFPKNFDRPYRAASIIEFWQRWHMTLSAFLRDYLLFQLPGNRARRRFLLNIFLTMLLGGIWHGAHWNFAIWGGLHGLYLVVNHQWRETGRTMNEWAARGLTLAAVLVAWVPFRAETLPGAWRYLRALTGTEAARGLPGGEWQLAAVGLLGLGVLLLPERAPAPLARWQAVALGVAFFLCLLLLRETSLQLRHSEFIYFRF